MRKLLCLLGMFCLLQGCYPKNSALDSPAVIPPSPVSIPPGLKKIVAAYPEQNLKAVNNALVWPDGTVMPYNIETGTKDYETLLNSPDLEDQMARGYPGGKDYPIPENMFDSPGRVRYYPFFKKMYGTNAGEVKAHLVPVKWLPSSVNTTIYITSVNGVNKKLQAVSDALDALPEKLQKYVLRCSGTFVWRNIARTHRLSAHSFGIAIDIDASFANYWKWDYPGKKEDDPEKMGYKNSIPPEIVEIFEAQGFIWGGKWYHYDTMHFEYRPELLIEGDR
ncbi:MAG: M15 family metallopeptidase [Spirochaetales bacterium]|nr:M15 family metallopeptidase [Spirochaetales bacterium]